MTSKRSEKNDEISIMKSTDKCPYCDGTGKSWVITTHTYTNIKKIISVPCVCFTSTTVSNEYKLLKHLGGQYMNPKDLDPKLTPNFDDISINENFILSGNYDSLLMVIKALIMKHRFDPRNPRILFSRSIDIVHNFHVPQEDGNAPHLSSTSKYSLVIVVFGSIEKNQALSPCMAQLVQNRLDEKKPTWIYFPETMPALTVSNQEFSPELAVLLDKYFKRLIVSSDTKIEGKGPSVSKQSVKRF
jgi:hypothetical protein